MRGVELERVFVKHLPGSLRHQANDVAALGEQLEQIVTAGREAWTDVELSDADVVAHLAARLPPDGRLAEQLTQVRAGDVFLACGCVRGSPAATAALERVYGPELTAAVAGLATDRLAVEDLAQTVRQKLYAPGTDGQPTLGRYNGLGSLGGWLRVVATRTALNALRDRGAPARHELPLQELGGAGPLDDPELDYFRQHYSGAFKDAFESAVGELEARQRTLLRYSIVHRMNVREIARMYGVHHATTARWIAGARERLVERTRELLADRLGVGHEQLESIMRMIQSRLDVSVARALESSR